MNDYFPEGLSPEDLSTLHGLKLSCYLNAALVALKLKHGKDAIAAANNALEVEQIDDKSKTKALYRKGMGYILVKDEEQAQKILEEALELEPNDAAIQKDYKKLNTTSSCVVTNKRRQWPSSSHKSYRPS